MILESKNLSLWYNQVIAINDVSLSIPPGITGVLGPNGAGKTTFLRVVMGLIRASSGSVRVFGVDPWGSRELAGRIGYCPEHDGLYEWMKGREFVLTMAGLRGVRDHGRVDLALERVRLQDVADRRIATYSRGMRQRLKFAQAIVHDPDLLILDEPLVGSDPLVKRELVSLIRRFAGEGKSILVSSHVLHEIEAITPRIVLLHRGRLLAEGDVREIRRLIDRHPHLVRIGTSKPRELAARLVGEAEVDEVRLEEGRLLVKTPQPEIFYAKLPGIILESGCPVEEVCSPDDNLEAVFRYLTEK